MSFFKCKMCGASLNISENSTVIECEYCGTMQTLPKLDDEKRARLYDRANHFRRGNEFDKAMAIYEQILNEDGTDAEAYWSIVLCRWGIEYVEDTLTHKRLPTVNRAQFSSIYDDEDYKSAIANADALQKSIYEKEAAAINEIQKGILEISQNEEPFDVFICYKETDERGRRTQDSVLATELYHELTREGLKVFFSRITLEDKLGVAYEPYIFAALHSAKVMVVIGTRPEYFNSVWVKNEWGRFLSLIKGGARKTLIPAYRDMDPYDIPEEFSHLQAQDMSKLGFMQDLLRGIKKLTKTDEPRIEKVQTVQVAASLDTTYVAPSITPLIKRAFIFLEDGEFDRADEFCEQALNIDPECAEAYLCKLLAELRLCTVERLSECHHPFESSGDYRKVIRFADSKLKDEMIGYVKKSIKNSVKQINYHLSIEEFDKANDLLRSLLIRDPKNPDALLCQLMCNLKAKSLDELKDRPEPFDNLDVYKTLHFCADLNLKSQLDEINRYIENRNRIARLEEKYQKAVDMMEKAKNCYDFEDAAEAFDSIKKHRDSAELAIKCRKLAKDDREAYIHDKYEADTYKDQNEKKAKGGLLIIFGIVAIIILISLIRSF